VSLFEQALRPPRARADDWHKAWWASLAALTLVKLWLDSALRVKAETFQIFDDAPYVRVAASILSGDWLGPYDHTSLLKGPLYAAWLALIHRLGIPLLLAQSALYAAAGLALVRELRQAGMGRRALVAIYGAYLFNPFVEVRVMREGR